ncbi:MAG: thiamine phosphate synthase [Planctomycetaceae bacterium]
MLEPQWTAGARRALSHATEGARAENAREVEPLHLLEALVDSESRAAQILVTFGVLPKFESAGDGDMESENEPISIPMSCETASPVPRSSTLDRVIAEAERAAHRTGQNAEVGTEHLLWGLVAVKSFAAEILAPHGIDAGSLESLLSLRDEEDDDDDPLDVDFSLSRSDPNAAERLHSLRMIDAAANRAREGLRVVEDFARFALGDKHLNTRLKHLRHDLAEALKSIPIGELLAARETQLDVGTGISTSAEGSRSNLLDVATAAFKRTQEAFRTLEEVGKLHSAEFGKAIESLRYRLYTLEKAIGTTASNQARLAGRNLYLLVTESLCARGSGPAIRNALAGGVDIVQVREKSLTDRKLIEHAKRVREWTREAGALFIMNDRADLTVVTDADGVHVGQDELSVREARLIVGPSKLVGVSTHTIEQARQAVLDGADYIGVGPVFSSGTKQFDELAGLDFVRQVAEEISLPWFAIGGITAANLDELKAAGATRIAVSGAICGASDSANSARALKSRLTGG